MPLIYHLNKRKSITKQAIFSCIALITEQVTSNFRHLETPGDIDIMFRQRT